MDTIFALASARGRAGVAVVRISGPEAWSAGVALAGSLPEDRKAGLRKLRWNGEVLDEALVLAFPKGASFTGEPVVELHLHGSIAVVGQVLRVLAEIPGLRLAEAGEFSRRALENGRLDLTQIEGLADLIDAETEAQRRQAMRVMSGAIGARAEGWRRALIRAAALVEATIDFADEEVPQDVTPEVVQLIREVRGDLQRQLAGFGAAERVREGFEVAILGRPNAGKSTLLNALAGREAALTSEIAGTTRDVIEVRMDLGGLAVTFLDTAGLRETDDRVEAMGVARALERAAAADLRIILLDESGEMPVAPEPQDLVVQGKADTVSGGVLRISGKTGEGIPALLAEISARLEGRATGAGLVVRERHHTAVLRAVERLEQAESEIAGPGRAELIAETLRDAVRALDSLVGRVDVEDLLDEIFASFCIGK